MKNIFAGLSIVADSIDFRNPKIIPFVLAGDFDNELLQTFYYTAHHKVAAGDEYKTDERSLYALRNLKDIIRHQLDTFFRQLEQEEKDARRMDVDRIRNELRNSSRQHEMGTVDEIAKKYGISKSEVRRRKAAGTLHELQITIDAQG